MDIEYLLGNAGRVAYELRKNFPEGENLVKHFVTEQEVVVLSNRKLYIFYMDSIIDYKFGKLQDIEITDNDKTISITLMKKVFNIQFKDNNDYELFVKYFTKYKD